MQLNDFSSTLKVLSQGGVEFIVVGGLASVLNGAPINTFDLDIVPARGAENIARLLRVLEDIDAVYRMQPERRLRPNATHLSSPGHSNLITSYGSLDVLGTIGQKLGYEDLLPHATQMEIRSGVKIRVLNLEKIIALKEELAGEKDLAVLPILRRTLEQKQRSAR